MFNKTRLQECLRVDFPKHCAGHVGHVLLGEHEVEARRGRGQRKKDLKGAARGGDAEAPTWETTKHTMLENFLADVKGNSCVKKQNVNRKSEQTLSTERRCIH